MTDEEIKKSYYQYQSPTVVFTTPKNRKITKSISLFGKDKKYWKKMTSKQLSGMLNKK
jgi:hypothetical protein